MNAVEQKRVDEATRWFMVLKQREVPAHTLEVWKKWEAVAENRRVFDEITRLWTVVDRVPRAEAKVIEYQPVNGRQKKKQRSWFVGLAAVLATAVVAGGVLLSERWWPMLPGIHVAVYETAVAQHREVKLSEGSRIELGAKTTVTTNFASSSRTVVLNSGEALFDVARDPRRPFRVIAGGSTITAIGTAFNVRKRADNHVVVTVTEGAVQIAPNEGTVNSGLTKRLERGQQITCDPQGRYGEARTNDDTALIAWRSGRLRFRSEPLKNVFPEVNRYSRRQIVLGDRVAAELPFTGTVFERDVDLWVDGLARVYPELEVIAIGTDNVLIRSRAQEPAR